MAVGFIQPPRSCARVALNEYRRGAGLLIWGMLDLRVHPPPGASRPGFLVAVRGFRVCPGDVKSCFKKFLSGCSPPTRLARFTALNPVKGFVFSGPAFQAST